MPYEHREGLMGLGKTGVCVKQHVYVFNFGMHINVHSRLIQDLKFYLSEAVNFLRAALALMVMVTYKIHFYWCC